MERNPASLNDRTTLKRISEADIGRCRRHGIGRKKKGKQPMSAIQRVRHLKMQGPSPMTSARRIVQRRTTANTSLTQGNENDRMALSSFLPSDALPEVVSQSGMRAESRRIDQRIISSKKKRSTVKAHKALTRVMAHASSYKRRSISISIGRDCRRRHRGRIGSFQRRFGCRFRWCNITNSSRSISTLIDRQTINPKPSSRRQLGAKSSSGFIRTAGLILGPTDLCL